MSLLTVPVVQAGSVNYKADFDTSRWEVSGSVFECSLTQNIPRYGEAVFYRRAGESLVFYLQTQESAMEAGRALLTSAAPSWRQGMPQKDIGYVDVQRSSRPLSLDTTHTRIVMAELDRGMMPTLIRRAWYSDEESISVGVSPVNFRSALGQYQECIADLLPVNFDQIERSTVFWRSGQMELDAQSREQLDNIIAYAKADPGVYSFQINGFTDTAGSSADNLEASRLRAFTVHQYLVSNGINEAMLETRYFGETEDYLIVRNERNAGDRDRNRRVTILLLRR